MKRSPTGLGLFSLRPIPAGRRVIEYAGRVVPDGEAAGKYLFDLGGGLTHDGRARSNPARHLNHSCQPNAEARVSGRRVWVWSLRAIRAGDEITIDYGPDYFDEHIRPEGCQCAECSRQTVKQEARSEGYPAGRPDAAPGGHPTPLSRPAEYLAVHHKHRASSPRQSLFATLLTSTHVRLIFSAIFRRAERLGSKGLLK